MMRTTSAPNTDRAMLAGNVHYPVLVRSGDDGRDELPRRAAGLAPDAFWLVTRAGLPAAHTAWAERLLGPAAPVRVLTAPDTPDTPWTVRPAPGSVVVALGGTGVGPPGRPRRRHRPGRPRRARSAADPPAHHPPGDDRHGLHPGAPRRPGCGARAGLADQRPFEQRPSAHT